jgi:hypothetical protein
MSSKTKKPSFAAVFLMLQDKRDQLDEEVERHPPQENKSNAYSVRLTVMQMGRIMFEREDDQIWN